MREMLTGGRMSRKQEIAGATVYFQDPDAIPGNYIYIDHAHIVRRLVDALRDDEPDLPPLCVCLTGPPGVGKTAAVWAAAQALQSPCYTVQGSTDCSAQDLVVFPVPTDMRSFDPVASGICTACVTGGIALFDEIGKVARHAPEALTPLASLLDERRTLWSDFLKVSLPAAPGFGFVCTTQNDEPLPPYLSQRMLTFRVPPPSLDVLLDIVRLKCPGAPGPVIAAFRNWASARQGLTARDACLIVHFACRRARGLGLQHLPAGAAERLVAEAAAALPRKEEAA